MSCHPIARGWPFVGCERPRRDSDHREDRKQTQHQDAIRQVSRHDVDGIRPTLAKPERTVSVR